MQQASAQPFSALEAAGITLTTINIGGGLPARYTHDVDEIGAYAGAVMAAMTKNLGNYLLHMIVEPGRLQKLKGIGEVNLKPRIGKGRGVEPGKVLLAKLNHAAFRSKVGTWASISE